MNMFFNTKKKNQWKSGIVLHFASLFMSGFILKKAGFLCLL